MYVCEKTPTQMSWFPKNESVNQPQEETTQEKSKETSKPVCVFNLNAVCKSQTLLSQQY